MSSKSSANGDVSTKKRGRPAKDRKPRQIKASDRTWKELREKIIPKLPVDNISDLLDEIASGHLEVVSQAISGIPIYRRLSILFEEPAYIFRSLISFTWRLSNQLKIVTSNDEIDTQVDILLKATTITFAVGYIHPDVFINNPSAYIRWLISQIVKARMKESEDNSSKESEDNSSKESEARIYKIANAIASLENSFLQESQVFKARIVGGLSIKQLMRIFELEEHSYSEYEISMMLKNAITAFRDKHYPDADDSKLSESATEAYDNTKKPGNHENNLINKDIEEYCNLASQNILSAENLIKLEEITNLARHHAYLDTFINEIDYGIAQEKGLDCDSIYKKFKELFEQVLEEKTKDIQNKLRSCKANTINFWKISEDLVEQEIGKEISIQELLKQEMPLSKYPALDNNTDK